MSEPERSDPGIWGPPRAEEEDSRSEALDYTYRPAEDEWRGYAPVHPEPAWRSLLRKLAAPFIAFGFLLWKFKFILAAVFKLKIFTTAGTMLVSIAAYTLLWGWQFAVGFVLLILVHELGHVAEAKRQGLDVTAPMFIPFLGALIMMKQLPQDVWREARVAIAGPLIGSLGAAATWGLAEAVDSDLLLALAFTGFFLNLFNLAPFGPLDGGRIVAAIHPAIWGLGLLLMVGLLIVAPNPILFIILIFGGLEAWHRWQHRNDPGMASYYSISRGKRVTVAVAYLGLIAVLAGAMSATFIERDL
jgi:Zn-dependent protease